MAQKAPRLYKWLNEDGSCIWGRGAWPLPTEAGKLGAWMPMIDGPLRVYGRGYHAFEAADLSTLMPLRPAMLVEVRLVRAVRVGNKWLAAKGRIVRVVFPRDARTEYEQHIMQPPSDDCLRARQLAWDERPTTDEYAEDSRAAWDTYRAAMAELLHAAGRESGGSA